MKNFRKIDKKEYKDLFDKVLSSTFFHGVEWHEFLEKEFKWLKFEYYSYKNNEAILPLARFKVFGKEKLVSLPFCEYGGPLLLRDSIDWEEFRKDILEGLGDNVKIKLHPYHPKISGLSTTSSSYLLSGFKKTSERELWGLFRKTLRYEINHAKEHNLIIKKCENLKELKRFYDLYVANLKRKKTIPYPWPLIQFLYQNPSNELLLAFYKGKVIAGSLFVEYVSSRFIVHYFLNASDYKYKKLGANYLILWNKIKSLIGKDIVLDLGASPQGSSLETFKRGWAGTGLPIYQIGVKKSEEGLRSSKLRNIWGLLPNFVVKALSSKLIKYRI
jgi:hypothetical protein